MAIKKYNVTCVICGYEAAVSPVWHSHNQHTCKGKTCVKVFKSLPENIRKQFDVVHEIKEDGEGWYFDRGKYYSERGDRIDPEANKDGSIITEREMCVWPKDFDQDYDLIKCYFNWIIENCELEFTQETRFSRREYYSYKSVYLNELIYPKISDDEIKKAIKELVILEFTISLSSDIIKICNHYNINTFFCIPVPYRIQRSNKLFK